MTLKELQALRKRRRTRCERLLGRIETILRHWLSQEHGCVFRQPCRSTGRWFVPDEGARIGAPAGDAAFADAGKLRTDCGGSSLIRLISGFLSGSQAVIANRARGTTLIAKVSTDDSVVPSFGKVATKNRQFPRLSGDRTTHVRSVCNRWLELPEPSRPGELNPSYPAVLARTRADLMCSLITSANSASGQMQSRDASYQLVSYGWQQRMAGLRPEVGRVSLRRGATHFWQGLLQRNRMTGAYNQTCSLTGLYSRVGTWGWLRLNRKDNVSLPVGQHTVGVPDGATDGNRHCVTSTQPAICRYRDLKQKSRDSCTELRGQVGPPAPIECQQVH